jgi:hypothetical protein
MRLKKLHTSLLIICFTSCILAKTSYSQNENIKNLIENLTEEAETEFDYSDLLDEFLFLQEHPLNINAEEANKLVELFLLDDLQYQNIRQYIDSNGFILSPQELLLIDGISLETFNNISPFIVGGEISTSNYVQPSKILKYGRHQAFLRYQCVAQEAEGYKNRSDSVWQNKPNSKYLGNADKYYLKYQFKYSDVFSAGLVAEKDAGELFFERIENPTLDSLIGDKYNMGFDFYTGHIFIQEQGILKQAVIGDYHLLFGQGLNMWSALAFGKSGSSINIRKFERNIKPNTSTDENKFLRGAAVQLGSSKINGTIFYSKKWQDATDFAGSEDQETQFLQSINGTGYHRTVSELLKKNNLQIELMGGRFSFDGKNYRIGITGSHTRLNKEVIFTGSPYQYFNFSGNENTVLGADFLFQLNKYSVFGEFSQQINSGSAFLTGLNAPLSNRVALAILYRNYQKNYQNLFGAAFGENSSNANEEGIYTGLRFQISSKLQLNTYADFFSFPWLKFRVDKPSVGQEYLASLDYDLSRSVQMQFRSRYKTKEINYYYEDLDHNQVENYEKYSLRYQISYQLHPLFRLKNRIEYQVYSTASGGQQLGFLIFQDVQFKSKNQKLSMYARYTLFDVDSYDARLYAYENDLLYVFSIPALFEKGSRAYFLINYKFNSTFHFWLKIAHTWYTNIDQISSGLNLIDDNKKTEIRAQLRIKI